MSDRFGFQFTKSIIPEKWILDGYVSIGSTGALSPTLASGGQTLPIWLKSITRNSAGNYTVVLTDSWATVPRINVEVIGADAFDGLQAQVILESTSGFQFVCYLPSTLVATDPSSGGGIQFIINVSNSVSV